MHKNKGLTILTFAFSLSLLIVGQSFGMDLSSSAQSSSVSRMNLNYPKTSSSSMTIDLTPIGTNSGDIKFVKLSQTDNTLDVTSATDKFVQCNILAAWKDFQNTINTVSDNDFIYLSLADKMAGLGFFDLSNLAIRQTKDKEITGLLIDDMKRYYFPNKKLKFDDEMFLAGVYSNITFNNQASEATNDLLAKENLLLTSDYANYLVALGSYKSEFYSRADKYINLAILQNPHNLSYYKLKAEILAENKKPDEALKIVEFLKEQNLNSYEYASKIKSLEQYILYKTKKNKWEKSYHLGYYYFLENDDSKAIRELQDALSSKHRVNKSIIYGLMSRVYLKTNEFEKAINTAQKSYKEDSGNPMALLTLGDLAYRNGNYKSALYYYKKASVKDKKDYSPFIKEAMTYQKLNNIKKAKDLYTKILKTHSDSWEAYYNI